MPIYEYQCQKCSNKLETIQKFSDPPLRECPVCHADELKKLVSAAAFRLKGGGWYETDFKSGSKKNLAGSEGKIESDGASGANQSKGADNTSGKSPSTAAGAGDSKKSSSSDSGSASSSSSAKKAD